MWSSSAVEAEVGEVCRTLSGSQMKQHDHRWNAIRSCVCGKPIKGPSRNKSGLCERCVKLKVGRSNSLRWKK